MKKCAMKTMCIFLCAVLLAVLFSGCSDGIKKLDFIYPFSADVKSYDPQVASTSDEYLIIENTFEGLIRINDDGTVQNGCAESYDISADGLTYTFKIKQGLKWDIDFEKYTEGEKKGEYMDKRLRMLGYEFDPDITAKDFVFALKRAVMPETNSPMYPTVSGIQNANEVHLGKMSPAALGVKAVDDYTLVIKLSAPDKSFLQTLTSSVAMPCNEEFFNACKGRYGLDIEYTLFNGQFYLSQILEESYLLKKNENYKGDFPAKADELTLKIVTDADKKDSKKTVTARLESGYFDAAFITGAESDKLKKAKGINYVPYQDTTWVMLFNNNDELFQSKKVRQAFCLGFTRLNKPEKSYLSDTRNYTPQSCLLNGKIVPEQIGATAPVQDTQKSIELWKQGLKVFDETDIDITIITTPDMENVLKAHLQGIQSGISTITKNEDGDIISYSIKVEVCEQNELNKRLRTGEYDAAFCSYKATSTSAITFLKGFSAPNRTGFNSKKFDAALANAEKATAEADVLKYIKEAEAQLLSSYSVYPLLKETSYYASAKGVTDIQFHAGSGRVSFVNARR